MPAIDETSRVQLRTLVFIRWVAIAGQVVALIVVHYGLGFDLPIVLTMTTVIASAVVNLAAQFGGGSGPISEKGAAGYLAFDIAQLAVLLFLTGGLGNPFAFLLLAPVAISATVLSLRSTIILCVLALVAITVLSVRHMALPWRGLPPELPTIYLLGVWTALAIGILFFAAYTWRVAQAARELSDGLFATQQALAREQRLSAMGTIAAAAAHELGSPLGTIAVVSRELSRDLPADSPIAEDVALLRTETDRCRDILAALAHNPEEDDAPFSAVPMSAVVENAAIRHQPETLTVIYDAMPLSGLDNSEEPRIRSAPEIIHGIGSLAQNAMQFADSEVIISTAWSESNVQVTIMDDGPGFPPFVLDRIGEPYISLRMTQEDHMGLGIFIAQTLLARTGAQLSFRNSQEGGAIVEIRWPRAVIEGVDSEMAG
ncbi:MAG: ActS/PrrB/RegB family redox-sensitive histidine kinase [Alphaproteobacteria bacterium]|nr:ActS/PrrB/RegB family redox-sensitive histidine kinase [Alphaproteobacteria bacterium]